MQTNRPKFEINSVAAIQHINVRKEGPEDEKILATDIKLSIKNVDRRLAGYFDDALEAFLWRADTDALVARNPFMQPVGFLNTISGADVTINDNHFLSCDLRKFVLMPKDGGVMDITCTVTMYPDANDVADMAAIVQDDAHVVIKEPPDLFNQSEGDDK